MVSPHMASQGMQHDVEDLERQLRREATPEIFVPLAKAYLRRGFPQESIRVCQKGLKSHESNEGQLTLARAYFDASIEKKSLMAKADQEVDFVLRQAPNSWEAHCLKGEIALAQQDVQKAIQALRQAHELNPHHPQARMLLKSLGVEIDIPQDQNGPFFVDVETHFTPRPTDSLGRTLRDIFLFFAVILGGVWLYANSSIHQKRIISLITLGRTQQDTNSYTGLKNAIKIYDKVLKSFDPHQPFALIHITESYYDLWRSHERNAKNEERFVQHFMLLRSQIPDRLLKKLASYHALVALMDFHQAEKKLSEGKKDQAKTVFQEVDRYLTKVNQKIPPHPRVFWMHGLVSEILQKPRYAGGFFKLAATFGWKNPMFRTRYAYYYYRLRKFSNAHEQYKQAQEQGGRTQTHIHDELASDRKERNAFCWLNPPMLMGEKAPVGMQLGTFDLLEDAVHAASRATVVPRCAFHPAIVHHYQGHNDYLMADIGDALAVLDSGVGMAEGFKIARTVRKNVKAAKAQNNLSSHNQAWADFLQAKVAWYQKDFKTAQAMVQSAIKRAPYEAYFHSLLGMILGQQKQVEDAWIAFQKALKKDPYVL
ncbi:MAG: tetratricopeptide repeat protein, partial [Myxococcota bacterium]